MATIEFVAFRGCFDHFWSWHENRFSVQPFAIQGPLVTAATAININYLAGGFSYLHSLFASHKHPELVNKALFGFVSSGFPSIMPLDGLRLFPHRAIPVPGAAQDQVPQLAGGAYNPPCNRSAVICFFAHICLSLLATLQCRLKSVGPCPELGSSFTHPAGTVILSLL
jgi:hypothetical protein